MELTTKEERSLILFLESCAVEHSGLVDVRHMNIDDMAIAEKWNEQKLIQFGRRAYRDIEASRKKYGNLRTSTCWCILSTEAWELAAKERRERAERMLSKRAWIKAQEK